MKKRFSIQKGFTLVELLVVFAMMGVLTVTSMASFYLFGRNQTYKTAVSDFVASLNDARLRSLNRVKPAACGAGSLEGYRMFLPPEGTSYKLSVKCGGNYIPLWDKNFPNLVTVAAGSLNTVFFDVGTGIVTQPGVITITGYGNSTTIDINEAGIISTY